MLTPRQIDHIVYHYYRAVREISSLQRGRVTLAIVRRRDLSGVRWEPVSAWLLHRGLSHQLSLSTTHLWVLYCICRSGIALTASQIATRLDQRFSLQNEVADVEIGARTSRTAVRKQIQRIREAIEECLERAQLSVDSVDILQSERTSTREIRYRTNAQIVWWSLARHANRTSE